VRGRDQRKEGGKGKGKEREKKEGKKKDQRKCVVFFLCLCLISKTPSDCLMTAPSLTDRRSLSLLGFTSRLFPTRLADLLKCQERGCFLVSAVAAGSLRSCWRGSVSYEEQDTLCSVTLDLEQLVLCLGILHW
jgi:hypothetical protein